jgi:uncharacterized protein YbgA (DUF1722 family)
VKTEQKCQFLADAFGPHIQQTLELAAGCHSEEKVNVLLRVVGGIQEYLSKQAMKDLLAGIAQFRWCNDTVLQILLSEHSKGLKLP